MVTVAEDDETDRDGPTQPTGEERVASTTRTMWRVRGTRRAQ